MLPNLACTSASVHIFVFLFFLFRFLKALCFKRTHVWFMEPRVSYLHSFVLNVKFVYSDHNRCPCAECVFYLSVMRGNDLRCTIWNVLRDETLQHTGHFPMQCKFGGLCLSALHAISFYPEHRGIKWLPYYMVSHQMTVILRSCFCRHLQSIANTGVWARTSRKQCRCNYTKFVEELLVLCAFLWFASVTECQ